MHLPGIVPLPEPALIVVVAVVLVVVLLFAVR